MESGGSVVIPARRHEPLPVAEHGVTLQVGHGDITKIDRVLEEGRLDWVNFVEMTSYHVGIEDHIDVFRQVREHT